ncbi:MAG: hypothetical protein KAH46_02225 [Mycobacterium sp.]|nr:hypothetical protein [Mycobacterium sp.]
MSTGIREFRSLREAMRSNSILVEELTNLEGFNNDCAIADRARSLLSTVTQPDPVPWPTTATEVTEEWINATITFTTETEQATARAELITRVITAAEQDAVNKAELAGTAILHNLHTRLTNVINQVRELKGLSGVTTASEAIVKDHNDDTGRTSIDAWQTLTTLSGEYENIRDAQHKIMVLFFSEHLARYGAKKSPDPLASELHAQNLDAVWATNWRDRTDTPWPADPVEKLLWLARSNAQPWVPTPGQLKRATQERIEEARTVTRQPGPTIAAARPAKPTFIFG